MKRVVISGAHSHHLRHRHPAFGAHADFVLAHFQRQQFRRMTPHVAAIHENLRARGKRCHPDGAAARGGGRHCGKQEQAQPNQGPIATGS
jgi:hypothetical protein